MIEWLLEFVANAGYLGVLITMILVFSFMPFPSQVVLLPAGYLASQGEMSFVLIVLAGTTGGIIGAHINYILANKLGRSVIIKYGKYLLISEDGLRKAEQFFDKHGQFSIVVGLITPGIGQLITLPAGLAAMHRVRFFFSAVAGAFLWNLAMVLLGYFFGDNQAFIADNWGKVTAGLFGTVAILATIYILISRKKAQ